MSAHLGGLLAGFLLGLLVPAKSMGVSSTPRSRF
jgi:membrane associated rhomboid family serine protease